METPVFLGERDHIPKVYEDSSKPSKTLLYFGYLWVVNPSPVIVPNECLGWDPLL